MLEDVNNILNSGDVPNLYGPEEMDRIMTACRPICAKKRIPATKLNVFAQVWRVPNAQKNVRYIVRGERQSLGSDPVYCQVGCSSHSLA